MPERYVVRQGEYLSRIAHEHGLEPDAIWSLAENEGIRRARPNREVLQPGDVLYLPDAPTRRPLRVNPGGVNRYRAAVPTTEVRLVLSERGEALANKKFQVNGAGRLPIFGTTDAEGAAIFRVPIHVREVELSFDDGSAAFRVLIGHMDPVEEEAGVRKRLQHLGFLSEQPHGADDGDPLERAIRAFQQQHDLTATGVLDESTRNALSRAHGS